MLGVVSDIANLTPSASLAELLERPQVPPASLPFIPPPRWAAELSRRMQDRFPDLGFDHQTRQLQAFIHPSFTSAAGEAHTMRSLSPIGEAILQREVGGWVLATFESLRREEAASLMVVLTGNSSLSRVLRDGWHLENMVLTDASADLLSRDKARSAKGLMRWLATSGADGIPEPFAAECVKAVIGAVYLERGMDATTAFCDAHVLPYLGI